MSTLTEQNSIFTLAIEGLFPIAQELKNFRAEDPALTDGFSIETKMGVDGKLSGNYVPKPIKQKIRLDNTSPSIIIFNEWIRAKSISRSVYFANATIKKDNGDSYQCLNGELTKSSGDPYEITWESVHLQARLRCGNSAMS